MKTQKISVKAQTVTNEKRIVSALAQSDSKKRNELINLSKHEIKILWNTTKGIKPTFFWLTTNGMNEINRLKESPLTDIMLLEKLTSNFVDFLSYLISDEKLNNRFLMKRISKVETLENGEEVEIIKTVKRETFTPISVFTILSTVTRKK